MKQLPPNKVTSSSLNIHGNYFYFARDIRDRSNSLDVPFHFSLNIPCIHITPKLIKSLTHSEDALSEKIFNKGYQFLFDRANEDRFKDDAKFEYFALKVG